MTTTISLATRDCIVLGCDSLATTIRPFLDPFLLADYFFEQNGELKRDAAPCYELAFVYLREKHRAHRKTAANTFRLACVLQKKKASCTDLEVKTTARSYLGMKKMVRDQKDRLPATTKRANGPFVRVAPTINSRTSSLPLSSQQPQNEPPPPRAEAQIPSEPPGTFEAPPQAPPQPQPAPMPAPAAVPSMPMSSCAPDDPNCAQPQQSL